MSSTCGGQCCAVFWIPNYDDLRERPERYDDGAYILDMLRPLTREQARVRGLLHGVEVSKLLRPSRNEGAILATCKHWDEETRLCGAYESRPRMCLDYPYGNGCSHGCDYDIPTWRVNALAIKNNFRPAATLPA